MRFSPIPLATALFYGMLASMLAPVLATIFASTATAQSLHCSPCYRVFGKVEVEGLAHQFFDLTNRGTKTLHITSMANSNSNFYIGKFDLPMGIKPGATVKLPVFFKPSATGLTEGVITLQSTAKNSTITMHVYGVGELDQGKLKINPPTLVFGNVAVGSSSKLKAMLEAENEAVTISSDETSGSEFSIVGLKLPATIPAGKALPVTIKFQPKVSGKSDAKLGFIIQGSANPTISGVTGVGVSATDHTVSLSWSPGGTGAAGYNVYRSRSSAGPFSAINTSLDTETNFSDETVEAGDTYYYVTTEVSAEGQESAHSNVAQAVIPSS